MQKNEVKEQVSFEDAQNDYTQRKLNYEDALKSDEVKSAAMWTGAGAGALGGIKLGASIGSGIAPGLGTFIGGLIGALGGGILGALAGSGIIEGLDWLNGSQEDLERQATGGLTSDEFSKFAAKAAESGLYMSGDDKSSKAEFQQLYEDMGFDKIANFDSVFSKMKELGSNFDTLGAEALSLSSA
jgi:hypothetical protein